MKSRNVLPVLSTLIAAGPASGEFVGLTFAEVPNEFALTYRLYAQFDGGPGDFVFAVAGTPMCPLSLVPDPFCPAPIYQNEFGDDLAPNPALFPFFPSLEFDSFVTIGKVTSIGDVTSISPGWPGFGPDGVVTDGSGWHITPDQPQGNPDADDRVLLAQLSTVPDTFGIVTGQILVAGFSGGQDFQACLPIGLHCDPPFCAWDLDGDFSVGITDLLILLSSWGAPYDVDDLSSLLAEWGC